MLYKMVLFFFQFSQNEWLNLNFHDVDRQNVIKPDELSIDEKKNSPPSRIDSGLLDRIQGSMFGMAIGDALGAHVEFRPRSYLEANPVKDLEGGGTWGLEKGQVTFILHFLIPILSIYSIRQKLKAKRSV
jgi:hypothetical protein